MSVIIQSTIVSDKNGFGAFMTKGSKQYNVAPGIVACSNIHCLNQTMVNVDSCECGTVHYCRNACRISDSDHKCHVRDTGVSFHEKEGATMLFPCKDGGKIKMYGLFKGVKEGKKFVRGTFVYEKKGFICTYSGELTSMKLKNGIVCAIAHGKGLSIYSPVMSFHGIFQMGVQLKGCATTIQSLKCHFKSSGINEIIIYERNDVKFAGSTHEVGMEMNYTARDSHDSWKETLDAMCLEFKGLGSDGGSDGVPVVISKKEINTRFNRYKVIKTEIIEKTRFRTCVHWNDEEEFSPNLPFIVTFSSCGTCNMHGKWNLASVCEMFTIDKVIQMNTENNVDYSCSCTLKNSYVSNNCLFSKPTPVQIPRIRNDGKGKKGGTKNQQTFVEKERGVKGVSTRNMIVDGNSNDDFSQVLVDGGWKLKRQKTHLVYERLIQDIRQTYVCPKTPSCHRWEKNAIKDLKNLDRKVKI